MGLEEFAMNKSLKVNLSDLKALLFWFIINYIDCVVIASGGQTNQCSNTLLGSKMCCNTLSSFSAKMNIKHLSTINILYNQSY